MIFAKIFIVLSEKLHKLKHSILQFHFMQLFPVNFLNEVIRQNILIELVVHDFRYKIIYVLVMVGLLVVLKICSKYLLYIFKTTSKLTINKTYIISKIKSCITSLIKIFCLMTLLKKGTGKSFIKLI